MEWLKVAGFVLSVMSAAGTFALFVLGLEIKKAILEERDAMKEWVGVRIAQSETRLKELWAAEGKHSG